MRIDSKAPTRIDLAGGTVDLWPLHLFLKNSLTINLAIDLFAEAQLEQKTGSSPGLCIQSLDQGQEKLYSWKQVESAFEQPSHPSHELALKLTSHFLKHKKSRGDFNPEDSLKMTLKARSPAGAGLGGSSTLSVAIVGALSFWLKASLDTEVEGEPLIDVIRDVETTVIKVPAGVQDYYGAMFGGLQSLHWGVGRHDRRHLNPDLIPELESRISLFYSGQSRNSGINNWDLYKAMIDNQSDIRARFQKIVDATLQLETALKSKDFKAVGQAIDLEWQTRKTLAQGITTPEIDLAMSHAKKLGATAAKICGAGGGGCFFIYSDDPSPELKKRIQTALTTSTVRALDFKAVSHGVHTQWQKS